MSHKHWNSLCKRVEAEMLARGLTQKQLASLSGLAQGTVSQILSGANKNPTISVILGISEALEIPISTLLGEPQKQDHSIEECYRRIGDALKSRRQEVTEDRCLQYLRSRGLDEDAIEALKANLDPQSNGGDHKSKKGQD